MVLRPNYSRKLIKYTFTRKSGPGLDLGTISETTKKTASGDFGFDRDSNRRPLPYDSSSGGDSVFFSSPPFPVLASGLIVDMCPDSQSHGLRTSFTSSSMSPTLSSSGGISQARFGDS